MSCETAVQEVAQCKARAIVDCLSLKGEEVLSHANPGAGVSLGVSAVLRLAKL